MYWYYKYPLYLIAGAIVFGLLYLIWQQLPDQWSGRMRAGTTAVAEDADSAPAVTSGSRASGSTTAPTASADALRPDTPVSANDRQRLQAATQQLQQQQPLAARVLARNVLRNNPEFSRVWFEAARIITEANTILINTDAPAPEKVRHTIARGESLVRIANRYKTTVATVQRSNKLDPASSVIFPGNVLHIYAGDWSIRVVKTKFVLLLMDGDELFKLYHVAIGRQDRTPVGIFQLENKLREPVWTPPGRVIAYGDPENVLGTRWLGLRPIQGTNPQLQGYGIHGTWEPQSIGSAASEGCVRMLNDDVNDLFDLVPEGTLVVIEEG